MSKNTAEAVWFVNEIGQTALSSQTVLSKQTSLSGPSRQHPRPSEGRAEDRMWANQLRARHGDLISRYAQRRLGSLEQADQVTQDVFAHAAANRSQVGEPALPWLIATARAQCAQYRQRPSRQVIRRFP